MAKSLRYWMTFLVLGISIAALSACGSDTSSSTEDGEEGRACLDDEDCNDDLRCVRYTAGEEMGSCSIIVDDRAEGQTCDDPEECASGLCHEDQCAFSCIDDTDCPDERSCDRDEGICRGGDFTQACTSPGDCTIEDTTCNLPNLDEDDQVDGAICGTTNPGEADLGEECTSVDDCESAYCWVSDDQETGECSVFCDEHDDCASAQRCISRGGGLNVCLAECLNNADCDGGNVCKLGNDPDDNAIYSYCGNTLGDDTTGDECTSTSQCDNGVCLAINHYETQDISCSEDSDCDSGFECACPPGDDDCAENLCVATGAQTVQRCTELCDPSVGDADCQSDAHDLEVCSDTIEVTWDSVQDTISACTLPFDD